MKVVYLPLLKMSNFKGSYFFCVTSFKHNTYNHTVDTHNYGTIKLHLSARQYLISVIALGRSSNRRYSVKKVVLIISKFHRKTPVLVSLATLLTHFQPMLHFYTL